MFLTRNLTEALSAGEALARRAVALDGDDAEARSRLAISLQSRGDYQGDRPKPSAPWQSVQTWPMPMERSAWC
jgi:hypothetical protein